MENLRIAHTANTSEVYRHIAKDFYTKEIVIIDNCIPLSIGTLLSGEKEQPGFWEILEQKGRVK